jgi:hypothetical protein
MKFLIFTLLLLSNQVFLKNLLSVKNDIRIIEQKYLEMIVDTCKTLIFI